MNKFCCGWHSHSFYEQNKGSITCTTIVTVFVSSTFVYLTLCVNSTVGLR